MVTKGEFRLPSSDGIHQLYVREWVPEGDVRGVIQLSHGIAEHMGRYEEYATVLAQAGYYVVGADHLGHGRTANGPEELGYTAEKAGWLKLCADLERVYQRAKRAYPDVPYVLLGHSMGSFLARTFLIRYPGRVDGCILSGTGQEAGAVVTLGANIAHLTAKKVGHQGRSPFLQKLMFGSYNRGFDPAEGEYAWISGVPQVVADYEADPLSGGIATCRLVEDMMWGLTYIWKAENLRKMDLSTPILLYSGDKDPVGGQGKQVEKVYRRFVDLGCQNVTMKLYPGGRHEMHNEENRQQVFQDVLDWLDENYFQN
jgi:alpha-beta hydrolase superfamily lysophospholipase